MKLSNSFFVTRREFPKDEETIASKLLIKSGMILKNSKGIYSYMPIGLKVLENIKKIIRSEMKKNHCEEVIVPTFVSSNVFEDSNRSELFDGEMYSLVDRNNNTFNLCPSSEELFAYLASYKIKSYKDLHFTLYQINNKYRDEKHPEYGLVRKKEFYMAESYSFDSDEGGLDVSYDKMFLTFKNIFNKLNIDTLVVESNAFEKNGISSEEFQVISEFGDNEVVKCTNCTYACNLEDASSKTINTEKEVDEKKKELIKTPNAKTIKEVSEYLNVFPSKVLKSIICKINGQYKMILLKGESELNIKKLKIFFKTNNIEIPSVYELEKIGTSVGYVGPINSTMEIIADNEVKGMKNFVCGANKNNYHYINVNYGRDFKINRYADLKLFDNNSLCPKCKNKCKIIKGIEVGQIYKLGTNYSELYNLKYTDEVNNECRVYMGSYQMGLDRCISAIVEKNHDDRGIIWPMEVAPYKVAIVVTNTNDHESLKYANNLYDKLNSIGIDTLIDDRKESIGVKFNDIDLIGIPIRITIGKKIEYNIVEIKLRSEEKIIDLNIVDVIDCIKRILKSK
ncbi:MAG: proline--tRNA ligase [Bacilli bacterium]|nr:proline--tRNA ligase [Bacilli bacterium]